MSLILTCDACKNPIRNADASPTIDYQEWGKDVKAHFCDGSCLLDFAESKFLDERKRRQEWRLEREIAQLEYDEEQRMLAEVRAIRKGSVTSPKSELTQ